ncbi:Nif3-like dinuclear metal center hexameric protein [Sphingomonas quercus]|uniref:Nif3-like dinuclear metal center hexameric protein n=1 Tax=Sphingomonas quercus TaxID=2842451 RepID=A0ABS6BJG1_9SPHN|nr:Nif3-like dinuclear metal center hexameric protein [Sphingomonas quercus]MBU3077364.1 Nif3-like dinuclear metal center hexameric protein [Sphingomonas quercus]
MTRHEDHGVSRRGVLAGGATAGFVASGRVALAAPRLTAGAVVERMKQHVGGPWREGGVDGYKSGSAETVVTGIATTMMATFDALKAARRHGLNLVITHESTYWSHQDRLTDLEDDPLYRRKRDFLAAHDMVAYHLHDHWHALKPVDGINLGTMQLMGWSRYRHADNQRMFTIPPTTLLALAQAFQQRMGTRTLRIVGDPALVVSTVYESWGFCSAIPGIDFLESEAQVLVIGETQDWDLIAYAQDAVASGRKKALIVLGHVLSEQWGMKACAEWLKGFVPEVPVRYLPIVEPYWNIDRPVFEIDTRLA